MSARRLMLNVALSCVALAVIAPAAADAFATITPPSSRSGVSGLPDGRVYEQVSPPNKYGNQVKLGGVGFVAGDGEAVMYVGEGALAEASSYAPLTGLYVSRRTSRDWTTRSAMPIPAVGVGAHGEEENVGLSSIPTQILVSSDLSHLAFGTWGHQPFMGAPDEGGFNNNLYLEGPDPFAEPEWIGRSLVEGEPGGTGENGGFSPSFFVGGTPDLSTIYFFYGGSLFPGASHLYEYRDGVLSDAGALPEGEQSTGSAFPAARLVTESGENAGNTAPGAYDNEVSADGSHLFFIREDGAGTLELYVLVTAADGTQSTTLVSQSQLPGHVGEPAPHGPFGMPSTEWLNGGPFEEPKGLSSPPGYVFASPDGSHAFFQSVDRLTEGAPEGGAVKTYDFDVETKTLEYVPRVVGSIVSVSAGGASLVFENTATSPFELDRWTAGAGGGSVTPIVQLPAPATTNACVSVLCVGPAYTSADGSVVVFSTESPIAGFNDGGAHLAAIFGGSTQYPNKEIFRYDASSNELSCLSCPPVEVTPSGNAVISEMQEFLNSPGTTGGEIVTEPGRGMSADGSRVFFDTPDALVARDVNGARDVYEWENGVVYLISSGRSAEPSRLVGSSESGRDVFFKTAEGIALGDTDEGYDVYDARIPRPGDTLPPAALPCQGDTCQGSPSTPNLLSAPASATFSGVGNLTPHNATEAAAKSKKKPKSKAKVKSRRGKKKRHKARSRKKRKRSIGKKGSVRTRVRRGQGRSR